MSSNTQHTILNTMVNDLNDDVEREFEWKYFSKNISEVPFISTAWGSSTEVEWQVERMI